MGAKRFRSRWVLAVAAGVGLVALTVFLNRWRLTPPNGLMIASIPQAVKPLTFVPVLPSGEVDIAGSGSSYFVTFARGAKAVAYAGLAPSGSAVTIGDRQGPVFEQIRPPFTFNADGTQLAYMAGFTVNVPFPRGVPERHSFGVLLPPTIQGSYPRIQWSVVVDGTRGHFVLPPSNDVAHPVWSPDGSKLAYIAFVDNSPILAVGVHRAPHSFVSAGRPVFSPDGSKLASVVKDSSGRLFVMVGSNAPAKNINDALETPARASVPLFEQKGGEKIFGDGSGYGWTGYLPEPHVEEIESPTFTADGRLLYAAKRSGKWFVAGIQEPPLFDAIQNLLVSADGAHVAYHARTDSQHFLVIDGVRHQFDDVGQLTFSSEGRALASAVKQRGKWFVFDGKSHGPAFDAILDVVLSPDGKKLAYVGVERQTKFVVLGTTGENPSAARRFGITGADQVSSLQFGPDGSSLEYGVVIGQRLWRSSVAHR